MSDKPTTGKELMQLLKKVRGDNFSPWDSFYEDEVQPFFPALEAFEYQRYLQEVFAVRRKEFEKLCKHIRAVTGGPFDTFGPFDSKQYRDYYTALTDDQKTHFDTFINECVSYTLSLDFRITMDHYTYQKHKFNVAKYAPRERFKLVYSLYNKSESLQTASLGYGSWSDHQIAELAAEAMELYRPLIENGEIDRIPELEETEAPVAVGISDTPYLIWTKNKTDLALLFHRLKSEGFVAPHDVEGFVAHHIRILKDNTAEKLTKEEVGIAIRQFSRAEPTVKGSPAVNSFWNRYAESSEEITGDDAEE